MNIKSNKKIIIIALAILLIAIIAFIISTEIVIAPGRTADKAIVPDIIATPQNPSAGNPLPDAPAKTEMIFGGDAMLSRVVNQKMEKYNDWTWPFAEVASLMSSADLTIINLESPYTIGGNHTVKTGSFSFNADPRSLAGLKSAGVDIVSLANNHATNQGKKGISDTQQILAGAGISYLGAGLNSAEANQPVIKEISGVKFGFLAYAYPDDYSVAGSSTPGIASMDLNRLPQAIRQLKTQADIIIILMHAGTEYVNKPNKQQTTFAHTAIEAGANLVVGHHPHWVQTTEIYQGKPIIYSLGNLVFDQMWSLETQQGALAKITWAGKSLEKIELTPIVISDYGQAKITTSTAVRQAIFNRMGLTGNTIDLTPISR